MSESTPPPHPSPKKPRGRGRQPEEAHYDPHRSHDEQFRKSLRFSVLAHAALFLALLVKTVGAPKKPIPLASSVRVDLVGLPDFTKKELESATPDLDALGKKLREAEKKSEMTLEREKKAEKAAKSGLALKKEKPRPKHDLKSAIDRIRALEEIEESVGAGKTKSAKAAPAKGNILAKGSSLSGEASGEYNEYADHMRTRLSSNWDLPIWLSKLGLSARVVVFLDRYGNVNSTVFAKPSGNKQFDEYVLRTIHQSQPFGPPPAEILDGGVTLGFPL